MHYTILGGRGYATLYEINNIGLSFNYYISWEVVLDLDHMKMNNEKFVLSKIMTI